MIMWCNRLSIVSLAALAALLILSCGSNLDDLDLSGCTRGCNDVAKQCLDDANKKLDACAPDDVPCMRSAFHESKACLTSCLDCLSACIEETEDRLKD